MGKGACRFEAARIELHRAYPERETAGDYYAIRAASRETCGCIAAVCFLGGALLVAALGLHSCATREDRPAARVGTLERPVIAQVQR